MFARPKYTAEKLHKIREVSMLIFACFVGKPSVSLVT